MDPAATQEIVSTSSGIFPLFLAVFLATLLSGIVWIFATYIGPRRPSREKLRSYECGIRSDEPVHSRIDVPFYKVGIFFLILGVELIFFFPWALALVNSDDRAGRLFALWDMVVFAGIVIPGFIFAWVKGGFEWWKPIAETDSKS